MVRSCFICHVPEPKPRFKFPKDEEKLQIWCKILQCSRPKQPGDVSGEVICSYHFNKEDLIHNQKKTTLKPGTLPVLKPSLETGDKAQQIQDMQTSEEYNIASEVKKLIWLMNFFL